MQTTLVFYNQWKELLTGLKRGEGNVAEFTLIELYANYVPHDKAGMLHIVVLGFSFLFSFGARYEPH